MKRAHVLTGFGLASLIVAGIAGAMWFSLSMGAAEPPLPKALPAATAGNGALFTAFVPVLRHPRCMNCHSQGDFPRQGDDSHRHTMNVRRGPDGHGVTRRSAAPAIRTTISRAHTCRLARRTGDCLQ